MKSKKDTSPVRSRDKVIQRKGLTGKDADAALGESNITVNKNAVPNDPQSPFVTSGLRIGTPAATTRGFKEEEMTQVATWIPGWNAFCWFC